VRIRVIGGGLAGPEAALTAARLGCPVDLYEMRTLVDGKPRLTPAHQTTEFGELVCSNSLKSESTNTAPWLLKQEMRRAGSALLRIADETAVPAGHALAVDRVEFSHRIAEAIAAEPLIRVIREEVTTLSTPPLQNEDGAKHVTILATGPLTSDALSREIERITGAGHLAFYDSISPIVDAETIDMERVYMAARWDKGTADYRIRFVYLAPVVLDQIRFYREHMQAVYAILGVVNPSLFDLVKTNDCEGVPLNLFWLADEVAPLELMTPGKAKELLKNEFNYVIPQNAGRHYLKYHLIKAGCSPELVEAQLGHWEAGQEPWGPFSNLDPLDFARQMAGYIPDIMESSGWRVLNRNWR